MSSHHPALAYSMAAALSAMGVLHFAKPKPFESIIPPQLPGSARFYNFTSGAWEVVTGALLANPSTRPAGGLSALALLAAVWPANFYQAYRDLESSKASTGKKIYHAVRLPLQIPVMRYAWSLYAEKNAKRR
ncbi:DoxX family protein [Corynebacterium guaraldiae]